MSVENLDTVIIYFYKQAVDGEDIVTPVPEPDVQDSDD